MYSHRPGHVTTPYVFALGYQNCPINPPNKSVFITSSRGAGLHMDHGKGCWSITNTEKWSGEAKVSSCRVEGEGDITPR